MISKIENNDFKRLSFQVILKILNEYVIINVCPLVIENGVRVTYGGGFNNISCFFLEKYEKKIELLFYGRFAFDRTRKLFQLYKNFKWFDGLFFYLPKKINWMSCCSEKTPKFAHILSLLEKNKRINIMVGNTISVVNRTEYSDEITFEAISIHFGSSLNPDNYQYWIKDFVLKNEKIKWLILYMGRNYERKNMDEINEYTENAFELHSPPGRSWTDIIICNCNSKDKRIKIEGPNELKLYRDRIKVRIDCDIFRNKKI